MPYIGLTIIKSLYKNSFSLWWAVIFSIELYFYRLKLNLLYFTFTIKVLEHSKLYSVEQLLTVFSPSLSSSKNCLFSSRFYLLWLRSVNSYRGPYQAPYAMSWFSRTANQLFILYLYFYLINPRRIWLSSYSKRRVLLDRIAIPDRSVAGINHFNVEPTSRFGCITRFVGQQVFIGWDRWDKSMNRFWKNHSWHQAAGVEHLVCRWFARA